MALVNQPPILASSFAVNGDKNTIPTTNSGTEGLASLSLGFPPITQQPVSQGGIPPQRADFNGIFNLITNFLMFIQNGSIFAYSSSLDYQPPAIVYGNNALYRCIATNGANTSAGVQPLSNTSYWQPLIPVGGITVSGNTITVTNETGTQIQYTIDTITNPPLQSDSSNKIVTSAWVKAYAPSKTGVGASGTWNITANKATADKNGLQIDTGYLKLSGGTMTGSISVITPQSGYWRLSDTNVEMNIGFANDSQPRFFVNNSGSGKTPLNIFANDDSVSMEYATSVKVPTPSTSDNSTKVATTAFVNNYAPSKTGSGASGIWNINISGNASTSTKATQDSVGQTINTTYIKGITANNDTLTITKGNGTTTTATINNVANATKATQDGNGNTISSTYLKLSGGTMNGVINSSLYSGSWINSNKGIAIINSTVTGGSGYTALATMKSNNGLFSLAKHNTEFKLQYTDNATIEAGTNAVTKTAVLLDESGNASFPGTVTAQTPATNDNSTKVATTAFVKSLFTANKQQNGWWKDSNTGIIWQWGSYHTTGTKQYFTFPITFPNNIFAITEAHIVVVDTDFKTGSILNPDKNGFTFISSETGYIANIIAIGY